MPEENKIPMSGAIEGGRDFLRESRQGIVERLRIAVFPSLQLHAGEIRVKFGFDRPTREGRCAGAGVMEADKEA